MSAKSFVRQITPLLVLASITCAPKPGGQTRGPLVIMIPGRLAKEGSFEDCVYQKVQGGMKLADALADCAKLEPPDLSGTGLDALDLMDGGTGVRLSDCYGDWNNNAPIEHSAGYSAAQHAEQQIALVKALREALLSDYRRETDPDLKKNLMDAMLEISDEASKALEQYETASQNLTPEERAYLQGLHLNDPDSDRPKKPAGSPSPAGDWVLPDDETGTARPVREGQSLCESVSEFVGECNRNGWRSPECKTFLDKMNGCLDRTVADPADPAEPCSIPPVDPETAREVALLHCWAVRRPAPGEDPCTDTIKGEAFEYFLRTGTAGGLDPCNDPHVRHTGEDCYPTFTLVKFGEPNVRDLIRWGFEKLGGPVFVIPVGPRDPDPEPQPIPTTPDP